MKLWREILVLALWALSQVGSAVLATEPESVQSRALLCRELLGLEDAAQLMIPEAAVAFAELAHRSVNYRGFSQGNPGRPIVVHPGGSASKIRELKYRLLVLRKNLRVETFGKTWIAFSLPGPAVPLFLEQLRAEAESEDEPLQLTTLDRLRHRWSVLRAIRIRHPLQNQNGWNQRAENAPWFYQSYSLFFPDPSGVRFNARTTPVVEGEVYKWLRNLRRTNAPMVGVQHDFFYLKDSDQAVIWLRRSDMLHPPTDRPIPRHWNELWDLL